MGTFHDVPIILAIEEGAFVFEYELQMVEVKEAEIIFGDRNKFDADRTHDCSIPPKADSKRSQL